MPWNTLPTPVADFLQSPAACVLEQAYPVSRVFKLVYVRPNLGLPSLVMAGRLAACRTAGMQADWSGFHSNRSGPGQLDKNTANLFDLLVRGQHLLVAQLVSEAYLLGFVLRLNPSAKRPVFGSQLLS